MPPTAVVFRPDHTYEVPGEVILPGITSRLRAAGIYYEFKDNGFLDPSKGDRVHQAVHFAIEGDLDEASVDPDEYGYVKAALSCIEREGMKVLGAEVPIGNRDLGYATKIDLLCEWRGKKTVCNWKTGVTVYRAYAIQSALEALLFTPETVQRLGVHLSADGTYKLQPYENRKDFDIAKAALTCAAWVYGGKR